MYHAGVRFDVGDLIKIHGKPYLYFGEDTDGYSVFHYMADYPRIDVQRLSVEWESPTIIDAIRLPRLSSIREAKG